MPVINLFSKRRKQARGEMPDVYTYDTLPKPLRVQIVHIIRGALGTDKRLSGNHAENAYEFIVSTMRKERGVFKLSQHTRSLDDELFNYFLDEDSTELALDIVELCFRLIEIHIVESYEYRANTNRNLSPEEAVTELNDRFKEHGVGYQFESGEIIRVDSEIVHSEVVKPALELLRGKDFQGANQEFLSAHEHYRHGRYKECLVDALKAFESTMKSICILRNWSVDEKAPASGLIKVCLENGLVPQHLQTQFSSLKSLMESGIPTVRNRSGGHGQGATPVLVPDYIAKYGLNLTASAILFLVDAHNASE